MTDAETSDLIDHFNDAWGAHDLDATLALCTDDVVFESTGPAPDGERHQGQDAVRAAWNPVFDDADAQFTAEEGSPPATGTCSGGVTTGMTVTSAASTCSSSGTARWPRSSRT